MSSSDQGRHDHRLRAPGHRRLPLRGAGSGSLASLALARTAPGRRRLQPAADAARPTGLMAEVIAFCVRGLPRCDETARQNRLDQTSTPPATHGVSPDGRIRRPPTITRSRRLAVPAILGLVPLALMGTNRWLAALVTGGIGYLIPDLIADARDTTASEGDSERPARCHRPDRRLRRSRLQPRPGHRPRERRVGPGDARARVASCARSPTRFARANRASKRFRASPNAPRLTTSAPSSRC